MAQGFTNGSTKPPPNPDVMDIDGPFEAPPSTLAAKLVNNLSNTRKPTLQRSRTIDQLAIEIQKFESLPVEEKIGPKLVAHNRRTIFVLTKEILDDLSLSNVKLDETYVEASEKAELVLDALEDAIRQTPSVLLETQGDDDLITTGRAVPLWLWLCPRLLRLTSKYTSENDWCEKIGNFFYSIFEVTEDANNELWGLSRTLITYFRHCVGAAINSVHLKTAVVLPLPSFEDEISLAGNPDFLAHGCSYPVLGGVEATVHAEFLLQLLIRLLCLHRAEVSVAAGTSELEELAIWVFESFLKLRKTYMHTELSFDDEYHRDRLGQDLNSLYQFLVVLKCHPTGVLICRGYEASCFLLEEYVKEDQDNIESKHMSKKSFCSLLLDIAAACRDFEPIKSEVRTRLLFALADLPVIRGATGNLAESEIDSQLATCIRILDRICEASIVEVDDNDQLELVDSHLLSQMASCKLDLKAQIFRNDGREEGESAKRKKLATNTEGDRLLVYYDKITSNLNHVQNGEDDRSSPSESIYVAGFQVVGYLACAYSSSLSAFWDRSGQLDYAECSVCDALGLSSLDETAVGHSESKTDSSAQVVIHSFRQTMSMGTFEQQEQARVAGMIALRRLAMHIDTKDFLDLEKSDLAKWCFASLTSKSRELRIAAGRTLPVFLHDRKCTDVIQRNRILALDGLKQLSDSSPMHFTETLVLAFGQLARVLRNRDLNFVLLRLIQYLGHPHQIVAAAAASEIMSAASAHGVSLRTLFAPFWRTMAYETVKDCQTRPQIAQSVAELLDMTVDELLGSTQAHTLPWLVLHNEKDAIRRISRARGDPDDYEVIVQNLGTIIPRLLVQNQEDLGGYVVKVIGSYSLKFEHSDYTGWLRSAAIMIASELLKLAGEDGGERNNRARYALDYLATECCNTTQSKGNKAQSIGIFFEQHGLGVMSHFADVLNDQSLWQSAGEKIRCLKAIQEMVIIGKSHVSPALPQINTCLHSAIENEELRSSAYMALGTMISCLDDEDVRDMMVSTLAITIHYWEHFDVPTRKYAREVVEYIANILPRIVGDRYAFEPRHLPSVESVPELADLQERLLQGSKCTSTYLQYFTFSKRFKSGNATVILRTFADMAKFLAKNQSVIQKWSLGEQFTDIIDKLFRAMLDASVKFNNSNSEIARLSAQCLGMIGCLDTNLFEAKRERDDYVVVSNFDEADDATDFAFYLLKNVLVQAFLSASSTKNQAFLSYTMQELLRICDISNAVTPDSRKGSAYADDFPEKRAELQEKWRELPDTVREILTPFLRSKYMPPNLKPYPVTYPIFKPSLDHKTWLRIFVRHLLEKQHNMNAGFIFPPLILAVRIEDTSVANCLLPYAALHTIVSGTDTDRDNIKGEIMNILRAKSEFNAHNELNNIKMCSEAVFRIIDYLALWSQEAQKSQGRRNRLSREQQIGLANVSELLESLPAKIISNRAVDCQSYARALYHWEANIRKERDELPDLPVNPNDLEHLQKIYTQIDEPDGIEGIAAHLHVLDIDQQVLGHRKAGRWTAAQSWYEIKLAENPKDTETQVNLVQCMKESGHYDALLNYVDGIPKTDDSIIKLIPFAAEAAWSTNRMDALKKFTETAPQDGGADFNVNVGRLLLHLQRGDHDGFGKITDSIKEQIGAAMTADNTSSRRACRDSLLKLHALVELDMIASMTMNREGEDSPAPERNVLRRLDIRLEALGANNYDKQYVLSLRRAAMELSRPAVSNGDIAQAWLTSARLARKDNSIHQAYNAVLHASNLGEEPAIIEHARLVWKEGHQRKAIRSLQGAIEKDVIGLHWRDDRTMNTQDKEKVSLLGARANLLLAKWLDKAAQTSVTAVRQQYQRAAQLHHSWERGHYYLGRHYNKLLEEQKALPRPQQSDNYVTGELARLVCENYLRSLNFGTKYIYQTLPRIITLWLELGMRVSSPNDEKFGNKDAVAQLQIQRKNQLSSLHGRFDKYFAKMPAYIFYTALPQIIARIAHPNQAVYKHLQQIIVKVIVAHPRQSLWTLLAVVISTQDERRNRGGVILNELRKQDPANAETGQIKIMDMVNMGQMLSQKLLFATEAGDFQGNRTQYCSLSKDLGFNQKSVCPNPLTVPVESTLMATLPTITSNIRTHSAFATEAVTIESFKDSVMIMSSLQKPRKIDARGSDGKLYSLLLKPKDDLRKDQRLMEFNSMINRSFKRDDAASKRQLYIKTYAVTPLNEECGIIEWVNGLKTLRDIVLNLYTAAGVVPNYAELKSNLQKAFDAENETERHKIYAGKVISRFPPIFHKWFAHQFPEPSAWFNARLRYTRSCAVMSMIGTILGLGDRHGENILFEEGNGGTFHVDFNCLFDKGLSFAQPERVPFRLTHNMIDAMGIYGYEGPFRVCAELTLKLLRQHEETLMTILEAFVYDPTLDLLESSPQQVKRKGRKKADQMTPHGVLEVIRRKLRGGVGEDKDSQGLGVEGQVDALIAMATDERNLAGMYIGWCAFI